MKKNAPAEGNDRFKDAPRLQETPPAAAASVPKLQALLETKSVRMDDMEPSVPEDPRIRQQYEATRAAIESRRLLAASLTA